MRPLLLAVLLSFVVGCDSTGDDAIDGWEAPTTPLLHPIAFEADAAPAVGDTARLSAAFRFVRASDSPFIAEHRFDRLIDSVYAANGPLWVEGGIELYPYLDHSAPTTAARVVGGEHTFSGAVTPVDTVRLSANVLAVRSDTMMAVVTLRVFSNQTEAEGSFASLGGGFEHACFVVRARDGVALGDCWETTPVE